MDLCLMVLIGLPGSGKTTFAKKLVETENFGFIHVSYDALIPFKVNNDDQKKWKEDRMAVLEIINKLVLCLRQKNTTFDENELNLQLQKLDFNKKIIIIIDDNMYYSSMRYSIYQIAKQNNIAFCQMYFDCSLDNAISINKDRKENSIPSNVIDKMFKKMEPPDSENHWEKFSLTIDKSDNLYEVFNLLTDCLDNTFYTSKPNNDNRESVLNCLTSISHQVDICLRQIISNRIKIKKDSEKLDKNQLKKLSTDLCVKKSEFLTKIGNGAILLPQHIIHEIQDGSSLEKTLLKQFLSENF